MPRGRRPFASPIEERKEQRKRHQVKDNFHDVANDWIEEQSLWRRDVYVLRKAHENIENSDFQGEDEDHGCGESNSFPRHPWVDYPKPAADVEPPHGECAGDYDQGDGY